jgi:hypothetical protein
MFNQLYLKTIANKHQKKPIYILNTVHQDTPSIAGY